MRVTVSSVLRINDPTVPVSQWIKKNLVLANPDYIKKQRMGFWTGNTPKAMYLFFIDGDDIVLPYGCLRHILELAPDAEVLPQFVDSKPVDYHCTVPLYDYQQTAMEAMKNGYYGILQSPAGSGKTQIGIALAASLGKKTLWLTHTIDLVNQSMNRAKQYMSQDLIGTIKEGQVNIGKAITFATVQTMCRLDLKQYEDYWDCIIVDECHRVAGSPTRWTQFSKVLNTLKARHKYGLSATVHRSDGLIQATFSLLGGVIHEVPETAVADKIMKVGICPIGTGVQLSKECINSDGTIAHGKLIDYICGHAERNKLILSYLKEEKDRSCLILSDRLEHLQALIDGLPKYMQDKAVFVSGKSEKKARETALEDMRKGKKQFLFATYSLAKEGLDIPRLERLFLVTPQKDYAVITQSIGRIARVFPGKEKPIAYDFVDDMDYLVRFYGRRARHYRKNGCYFVRLDDGAEGK